VFELALRWLRDRDPGPSEGDAGARRFSPRQSHHRPRWRACGAGLGARPYRRSHGRSRVDLRQFVALRCEIDKPSAGSVSREELLLATRRLAAASIPERAKFWEVMGTLRWALMCCVMQRLSQRPRAFHRARDDRPPLLGNRDRPVAAAGTTRKMICRTNRHPPS